MMTVGELIAALEDYPEEYEVRMVYQPNWPLQSRLCNVISDEEMRDGLDEPDEERDDDEPEEVVYVTEGSQVGYGSKAAWQ